MLIKILSMTFDSARGGFNDEELRDFIKDNEIVSIRDHLFIRNEVPYLTMVIKYFPLRQEIDSKMGPRGKRDEPWREMLTEADMGLFNLFRDWRAQRCKKEGVPPYILLTNDRASQGQLECRKAARSASNLLRIQASAPQGIRARDGLAQ